MEGNKDIQQNLPPGKEWVEGSPTIELNQICFVRAINDTRQIVTKEINGEAKISLTSVEDSSKGEYDISTVHFSINHKVESHSWGSWFDPRIVIVTPAEKLIKENGNPESMIAVDTFWSKELMLPKGTKILSVGKNSFDNKTINGIEILKSKVTENELGELKKLERVFLNDITNYQKESDYRSFGKEIDKKITEEVENIITGMNYSVLNEDHGSYMGNNNLDIAISKLARRLGIKNSTTHENTIYANMSDLVGEKGLLNVITGIQFKTQSKLSEETEFSSLIDSINGVFEKQKIETKGQEDVILRFSAQLYNAIIKYPEITNEPISCDSLRRLFEYNPFILENINKWSTNDQKTGNIVKERIEKIKQTEP